MTDSRPDLQLGSQPAPRAGAFPDFFVLQRRRLLSIAYRMLGSHAEAEDVVQDAWLRWQASATAGLREPAAWLTTVVTRLSIDRLRALRTEREARRDGWLPEPWLEPAAPSVEDLVLDGAQLSHGLMLLLERLSPDERAAFLLREAFDCDYAAIGAALERSEAHCRQLVHRARGRLARAGQALQPADLARRQEVERLRAAIEAQDQAAVLDALAGVRRVGDASEPVHASARGEPVALGADAGFAWMEDGEITALWVPCLDADGRPTLRVVTQAAALAAANRAVGRKAVAALLARLFRGAALASPAVSG
ncbi:sigma-70 family RNA polymerase sigma factor [Burkholderia plantarii]|uniref:RNA polymerase, sigma-24 subunit, ECF subfamily n=1 Tax=Burkholderia plantarii TaxID=41899 RepID=A0A0B6S3B9_BURPL|nr:sigma-70 family RNA polymerase sigma factor [Burkholderia plantarii]AJK48859.1 RNA polymerase, sigma-24 subunit, ECF subfamily [Burkholderia plantarii]